MDDDGEIGRRLREIRSWHGLSLEVVAGLAGISTGYLSRLETGDRPVTKRRTVEDLARALRVSPDRLTGRPWHSGDPALGRDAAAVRLVEAALDQYDLDVDPDVPVREWPEIARDVERLAVLAHVEADYTAQADLVPGLLAELHAVAARDPARRREALVGLIHCYASAAWVAKRLGGAGLPSLAARLAQRCAREHGDARWRAFAVWLRGDAAGSLSRPQQYERAVREIDSIPGAELTDPEVTQAVGMLHLSAALAAATGGDQARMDTHLGEADRLAARLPTEVGGFARLWFGRVNVGVWRVGLAAETGDTGTAITTARGLDVTAIPSASRQAEYWIDLGRVQLGETATAEQGLAAVLRAEQLAPQRVRHDLFVREAVAHRLRTARRAAGGTALRGLAWRMGLAPTT